MAASLTPKGAQGQLGSASTPTQIYVAPALTTTQVRALDFTNIDTVAHTVTVWRLPSGQTAPTALGTQTAYIYGWNAASIGPNVPGDADDRRLLLNPGDSIYALPSAANQINWALAYVEETF